MNSLYAAIAFLINALFGLYLYVLAMRLLLAFTQANYFNPITQLVVKLSKRLVNPVRKVIPNFRNIELATLIWIFIFEALKLVILSFVVDNTPPLSLIFFYAITETLKLILNVYFYAILLQAILSWVHQGDTPIGQLLEQMTTPILRPLRRIIPPLAGFDITPIPALLILQFFIILIP